MRIAITALLLLMSTSSLHADPKQVKAEIYALCNLGINFVGDSVVVKLVPIDHEQEYFAGEFSQEIAFPAKSSKKIREHVGVSVWYDLKSAVVVIKSWNKNIVQTINMGDMWLDQSLYNMENRDSDSDKEVSFSFFNSTSKGKIDRELDQIFDQGHFHFSCNEFTMDETKAYAYILNPDQKSQFKNRYIKLPW